MALFKSFQIPYQDDELTDLKQRLLQTRWPDEIEKSDWKYGANLTYLKEICAYWATTFDWKSQVDQLNKLPHFYGEIDGFGLHFIHIKSKSKKAKPLLLTHGFPDGFVRFLKLIPLLTAEDSDGFSFHLIIPSLPGFGYAQAATASGMGPRKVSDFFAGLMKALGYNKYFAHGGDWGSSITEQLALNHSDHLIGMHLTDIPYKRIFSVNPEDLSKEEQEYIKNGQAWSQKEGGYGMIQSTKPQTLAYGLNDSPAGLAAWILDLFNAWCDCNGSLENKFSKDELLTNISIYWFTQTINSACRIYYESLMEKSVDASVKVKVPTAGAIFPEDLVTAPKAFAERLYNVKRWTIMPRGGHFAALEQPELLAKDLREFFKTLS